MKSKKRNLFHETERKLTYRYSSLIILFLILFIIILYSIVFIWFTTAEKNELQRAAQHEGELVARFLSGNFDSVRAERRETPEFLTTDSNQLFYYVFTINDELVLQNEQLPFLQEAFLKTLTSWKPAVEEMKKEKLTFNMKQMRQNGKDNRFSTYTPKDQTLTLFIIAKPIYERETLIGHLYMGQDITDLTRLLKGLLIILIISAIVFSGISFSFSRIMSKRAMIPIKHAFKRQQEFVADASHELRTPLSVMLSSMEILELEIETKNEISTKMMKNVKEEIKRMTSLVGDLLTLARSDSEDHAISFESFDLQPLALRTLSSFEAYAKQKHIRLASNLPDHILMSGSKERITQLLYILLDNAIKYSKEKGSVTLSILNSANYIEISVQDMGIGIAEHELPYIFERFYRIDKARTRQQGGHGLGLSIAKWIVDLHGGKISVESELEKGSTFIVRIPQKL